MTGPKEIQQSNRRKSIALLTRSPLSQSPYTINNSRNNSPRTSNNNSYINNNQFLRKDNVNDSAIEDNDSLSGNEQIEPDLSKGIKDRNMIKKISKHLPNDDLNQEGADITRDLYKIQQDQIRQPLLKRSKSYGSISDNGSIKSRASSFNVPGGFRREYLLQKQSERSNAMPSFVTKNFIEFLSIYGHFAGEDLEDEEDFIANHYSYLIARDTEEESTPDFNPKGTATDKKAYFLLLKAFVGTGVLFLPKAFTNGGLLFSILVLVFFAILSWWCYLILVYTKVTTKVSGFAEIGLILYGPWLQKLILFSIIISQIGFVAAYIVFTSENLRAFIVNITTFNTEDLKIYWFIIFQIILIIPLSLIRDITKLSLSAVLANFFILSGLLTILYFIFYQWLFFNEGQFGPNVEYLFNQSEFSLFIGTAIFAFEGIGLIIPIQESMIHPNNFPKVLAKVIFTIALIFIIIGTLGYLTFGSNVQTVILLNLPQDSPMVIITQLLYSFAILLSTPLQLFPAIRLCESKLFFKSGKTKPSIKWLKNLFRTSFVLLTSYIAFMGGKNLDKLVSFVGCFACIPLVYMYPPMLHLKSCCIISDDLSKEEKTKRYWIGILDYFLVFIGGIAMIYTTYQVLFT
ncbi:unnamed protein product [Candida verbasci]|uniref:Amino acid transporter transmembrane domain-containing protein n=1 Tax=Candida verbasci TaxID=1227364 RepID=A0A9W4TV38_9ASCO|nr:unnamed protein product [Candida verbasci]